MTDNSRIALALFLIFGEEFLCSGEGNLGDVALYLIFGHADAVIRDNQLLFFRVDGHNDLRLIALLFGSLTDSAQALEFLDGIASVGNNLSEEDVLVRIEPLLYNWKHIFGIDADLSLPFHVNQTSWYAKTWGNFSLFPPLNFRYSMKIVF